MSHSDVVRSPRMGREELQPNALAIEVMDLRKSYGSLEAVRGVSFTIAHGEVF
jgi:ABC-type uncharacterized transport system ATPase subunit